MYIENREKRLHRIRRNWRDPLVTYTEGIPDLHDQIIWIHLYTSKMSQPHSTIERRKATDRESIEELGNKGTVLTVYVLG